MQIEFLGFLLITYCSYDSPIYIPIVVVVMFINFPLSII